MTKVGNQAPDFTLPDQDRRDVVLTEKLAEHGVVVLAFFPAAFSSVCTKELCTFRDQLGSLDRLKNTCVLGISVDTPFSLKVFSTQEALNFPLLSDFNKTVIRAYGVVNPDMIGLKDISKRAVFVVGPDGSIRHQEVLDDARLEPNYEKLYEVVKAI
jgi:peroxiredoxin